MMKVVEINRKQNKPSPNSEGGRNLIFLPRPPPDAGRIIGWSGEGDERRSKRERLDQPHLLQHQILSGTLKLKGKVCFGSF